MPTPLLTALISLAVAFVTTYGLVPQVLRLAIQWRLADKPNGRKLHARAIPHLGGVAMFGGFFLALMVSLGSQPEAAFASRVLGLLPALLVLFGLGLVDDLRGLRPSVKLAYQIIGAVCVVSMGVGFPTAGNESLLYLLLVAGLGIAWYVGACNSMNLIDGLDGLAAGVAVLAALGFLVVAVHIGDSAAAILSLCLIGSTVAFLRFNFHPARIFMGDTGSMFLGFGLASIACLLALDLGIWRALLGGAALLGLPILDTGSTVCRRLVTRRSIFEADQEHTHHRLIQAGLSHRSAVLVLYAISLAFTVLGCGVLLGRTSWFAGAVALAVAVSFGVSALARRGQARLDSQANATTAILPSRPVPDPAESASDMVGTLPPSAGASS